MANGTAYRRGGAYWIQYRIRGKQIREPGGFDGRGARKRSEAEAKLRERLGEIQTHAYVGPEAERVTVDELLDSYEAHLVTAGKKSGKQVRSHLAPVRARLGERRAVDVTTDDVRTFVVWMSEQPSKRGEKFSAATINRALQGLRAALNLARKESKLVRIPYVPLGRENNTRTGFFERADFEAVVSKLPETEADAARFGYLTGWRLGEILPLTWEDVDRDDATITLRDSKNGEGRTVPIDEDLSKVIERRWDARVFTREDGTETVARFVFHDRGFRRWKLKTWDAACIAAKCPGRLFHDLRRTAVRDMVRAGVPQSVAMARTGHKTFSVFLRYNITSAEDQIDAARRLREYRDTRPAASNVADFQREHKSEHESDATLASAS